MSLSIDEILSFIEVPEELKKNPDYKELEGELGNMFGALVTLIEDAAARAIDTINNGGQFSVKEFQGSLLSVQRSAAWEGLVGLVPRITDIGPLRIVGKGMDAYGVVKAIHEDGWEGGAKELGKLAFTSLATAAAVGVAGLLIAAVAAGGSTALAAGAISVVGLAVISGVAAVADYLSSDLYDYLVGESEKAAKGTGDDVIIKTSSVDGIGSSPAGVMLHLLGGGNALLLHEVANQSFIESQNEAMNESLMKKVVYNQNILHMNDNGKRFAIVDSKDRLLIERNNVSLIEGESYVISDVLLQIGDKINLPSGVRIVSGGILWPLLRGLPACPSRKWSR